MSDQEQEFDLSGGEDVQLEKALVEYANAMEPADRIAFLQKLKDDRDYFSSMGKSLSEIAMLIAGAAVIDDDAEFVKMRRRILFESRSDNAEIVKLRLYYLHNRDAVDMDAVIEDDVSRKRYEARLVDFLKDYNQQHPSA